MTATVRDVMTTRVVAVRQDAYFKEIVGVLRRFRVSACPVVDDSGRVIGVVSEADLLCKQSDPALPAGLIRLSWRLAERTKATAVTAAGLMTAPAVCIRADADVSQAARLMQDKHVKRLPVVDGSGRLTGIVSRSDLLTVFDRPDAEIAVAVAEVLASELAEQTGDLDVTVASGVVTIAGPVRDRGSALRALARIRHTDGVVAVRDLLSYTGSGAAAVTSPGCGVR